MVMKLR